MAGSSLFFVSVFSYTQLRIEPSTRVSLAKVLSISNYELGKFFTIEPAEPCFKTPTSIGTQAAVLAGLNVFACNDKNHIIGLYDGLLVIVVLYNVIVNVVSSC